MTNKNLLLGHLKMHGDTQESLSVALGISLNALNGKINGKTDFTQGEIAVIADRYHLDGERVAEIFLCQKSPLAVNNDG